MNFIKKLTGKEEAKSSGCCGVDIQEVEVSKGDSCCGVDESAITKTDSCCGTAKESESSCC
ncbi:hypothetical protein ACFSCX_21290 [Bacillus salitolerans]|uniref:Uncharacterized protein n=1 Tax=Bacillus salitolerans TaxID=1437434 RepID=A0ABW4LX95_9BACI